VEYRERTGLAGNVIYEILTDYQRERPHGTGPLCGNGWLRLLEFIPNDNKIHISPITVESGTTDIFPGPDEFYYEAHYSHDPSAEDHTYSIDYDMSSNMLPYAFDQSIIHFNDMPVNSVSTGQQLKPAIAMGPNGNFVVVWEDDKDNNGYYQIYARGFSADGTEFLPDMAVNSEASGQQYLPDVALDDDQNFIVVWQDDLDRNLYYEILARGIETYDLTIESNDGGSVTQPGEGTFINYPPGTKVTLVAESELGYRFVKWVGDVNDPSLAITTVTMDANKDITSKFSCFDGDFDGDHDVDGSDLAVFAADFGRTDCSGDCEGDFDTDNDVDGSDLAVFAADFGRTDCP
jgi:hypothetical protein